MDVLNRGEGGGLVNTKMLHWLVLKKTWKPRNSLPLIIFKTEHVIAINIQCSHQTQSRACDSNKHSVQSPNSKHVMHVFQGCGHSFHIVIKCNLPDISMWRFVKCSWQWTPLYWERQQTQQSTILTYCWTFKRLMAMND